MQAQQEVSNHKNGHAIGSFPGYPAQDQAPVLTTDATNKAPRKKGKLRVDEMAIIQKCDKLLSFLSSEEKSRVISWLADKHGAELGGRGIAHAARELLR